MGGWQEYSVVDGGSGAIRKIDTRQIPMTAYLGAVGMPGVTAWYGLNKICEAKPGQTITVSAASGAVGSIVGQLAKAKGCRAVGFAGGPDKCGYVVDELGFDACIDYKAHPEPKSLYAALKAATPDGVHGHFENVGGAILDAVLAAHERLRPHRAVRHDQRLQRRADPAARAAVDPDLAPARRGLHRQRTLDQWPAALAELAPMVAAGKLKYRETIADGLESAPEAFFGLLKGKNFGKQLSNWD